MITRFKKHPFIWSIVGVGIVGILIFIGLTNPVSSSSADIDKEKGISSSQQNITLTEEEYIEFSDEYKRESEHIKFYYSEKNAAYIEDMAKKIEGEYDRIVEDLQVENIDKKIAVTIYPTLEEFHKAISNSYAYSPNALPNTLPNWVVGVAGSYSVRMVSPNSDGLVHDYSSLMDVAVHEFTHVLTNIQYPQVNEKWLLEAIATYEANQFVDPKNVEYLVEGNYPSIKELINERPLPKKIYHVGYILIDYIKEKWSMDEVREMLKENGDIEKVLGITENEFEKEFYKYLEEKYLESN